MKNRKVLALALAAALSLPITALGQQPDEPSQDTGDWAAVMKVSPGQKMSVRLTDFKKIEGRFESASDTSITLVRGKKTTEIAKDQIRQVYRLVPKKRRSSIAKSTGIGAAIGFGAGAGVGIWGGSYEDLETAPLVALLGGIGAGVGAGIGALVGAISRPGHSRVLMYERK